MSNVLLMGLAGFLGSILLYLFSGYEQVILKSADFPYGTITVNLTGCLIIGFLSQLAESQSALRLKTEDFLAHTESRIKRGMLATAEKIQIRICRGGETSQ